MKKKTSWFWLMTAALFLILSPILPAQENPSDHYAAFESKGAGSTVAYMIATPLHPSASFSQEIMNVTNRFDFRIPEPEFSLVPEPKPETTDASRYFQNRFHNQKWESTLFDASLIAHAALNVADYFSTREALKYPGLQEGNPLMKPFVKNDFAFAAVKIGITAGNHFLMKNIYKNNKTMGWIISLTSNFLMSCIVVHNFELINQARR
jgi:hypothetical protein